MNPMVQVGLIAALGALACMGVLCWLGAYAKQVRQLYLSCMQIIFSPFQQVTTWLQDARRAVMDWMRTQVVAESTSEKHHLLMWLFGSVISTALTAVFLYCDLGVLAETFDSLGLKASMLSDTDPGTLMAVATFLAPVAWGLFLFDAVGATHLAPWIHNLTPSVLKAFKLLCLFEIVVAIAALGLLGYYRADIIVHGIAPAAQAASPQPVAEPDDIDVAISQLQQSQSRALTNAYSPSPWVPLVAFCCAQEAIIPASLISFTGSVPLLKWLTLGLAWLPLLPLVLIGGIFTLIQMVINWIVSAFGTALDIAIENGQAILRKFGWRSQDEADTPPVHGQQSTATTETIETTPTQGSGGQPVDSAEFSYRSSSNGFDPMGISRKENQ